MADLKNLLQNADWKTEKHTPAIDAPDTVKKGKMFQVTATVGKEVAHPNTTPHHIRWIMLYFKPADDKFPGARHKRRIHSSRSNSVLKNG